MNTDSVRRHQSCARCSSADSDAALELLRPARQFGSFLGPRMKVHVELMRSPGHRYDVYAGYLRRFDRFLQGRADLVGESLPTLIAAWRQASPGLEHALEAQRCGRILSKAWRRTDSTVVLASSDAILERQVREAHRRPYIYTEDEIQRLLETARCFPSPLAPLRPLSLYTMLVLAYCAGLRLSEIVGLTVGDVHVDEATIGIRNTKFFKSRRLPLAPTVMSALQFYLAAREKAGAPIKPTAGLFWHQQAAGRYSHVMAGKLLVRVFASFRHQTDARKNRSQNPRSAPLDGRPPNVAMVSRRHQSPIAPTVPGDLSRAQGHQLDAHLPHRHAGTTSTSQ